jgi:hypothetical protein
MFQGSTNLNRNRSLPARQPTIGGQVIPQRQVPEPAPTSAPPRPAAPSQGLSGPDTLPHWSSEEIDRRLIESAKLLQEWTDLMNKTGFTIYILFSSNL